MRQFQLDVQFGDGSLHFLFGILATSQEIKNELRRIAARRNWGRARKVSYKRPSPQLSRRDLELLQAQARLNAIVMTRGEEEVFQRITRKQTK